MTKKNFFGDTIFLPHDTPGDFIAWLDDGRHGTPTSAEISNDDAFKWCAEVETTDAPGYVGQVHEFESREALVAWLVEAGVPEHEIHEN